MIWIRAKTIKTYNIKILFLIKVWIYNSYLNFLFEKRITFAMEFNFIIKYTFDNFFNFNIIITILKNIVFFWKLIK